jgi:hypothetical protein
LGASFQLDDVKLAKAQSGFGDLRELFSYSGYVLLVGDFEISAGWHVPTIDEFIPYTEVQDLIEDGRIGELLIGYIKKTATEYLKEWGEKLQALLN